MSTFSLPTSLKLFPFGGVVSFEIPQEWPPRWENTYRKEFCILQSRHSAFFATRRIGALSLPERLCVEKEAASSVTFSEESEETNFRNWEDIEEGNIYLQYHAPQC